MTVSYDRFTEAFLDKITEYDFIHLEESNRTAIVDGYMHRACAEFAVVCKYGLDKGDDEARSFDLGDITEGDAWEIIDIVSEGMVYHWMKSRLYTQRNLEQQLNTNDFLAYSPAELTYRILGAYKNLKRDFINLVRDWSYRHGDLTTLHL